LDWVFESTPLFVALLGALVVAAATLLGFWRLAQVERQLLEQRREDLEKVLGPFTIPEYARELTRDAQLSREALSTRVDRLQGQVRELSGRLSEFREESTDNNKAVLELYSALLRAQQQELERVITLLSTQLDVSAAIDLPAEIIAALERRAPLPAPPASSSSTSAKAPPTPSETPVPSEIGEQDVVRVMFATNRAKSQRMDEHFGTARWPTTSYGSAVVKIPPNHLDGKIERPLVIKLFNIKIYQGVEDTSRHLSIHEFELLSLNDWKERLRTKPTALLFIHGFNVSFDSALYQTAQIAYDLQTPAMPVMFSWPSMGKVADYGYDSDSIDVGAPALVEVLKHMADAGIAEVHVLAHSMGCRLLLKALQLLGSGEIRLGQVMLAAPDIDKGIFEAQAGHIVDRADGVTLYASSLDKALKLSKKLHGDFERAGDVPKRGGPVSVKRVDTIDITAAGGDLIAHGTFAQAGSLLNDLNLLVRNGERPPNVRQSMFKPMPKGQTPPAFWRFVKAKL
jgi:esterase/lipase superfamily enzyme